MKHLKTWITENIRPELQQPKNAAGLVLVIVSFLLFFAVLSENIQSPAPIIIAAAAYVAGMILMFIPDHRNQDHTGTDETNEARAKPEKTVRNVNYEQR